MTTQELTAEKKYLMAMHMADDLRKKGLLTPDEYAVIDTKMRAKYGPIFGTLCSELTCYSSNVE